MNYWIFKCNPKRYNIDLRLARNTEDQITWSANQYEKEIAAGDIAFIWRTGRKWGIYAVMQIEESPRKRADLESERRYYLDYDVGECMRVLGRLTHRLKGIHAKELKNTPGLENLSALYGFRQGTNFRVTPEEGRILMSLIEQAEHPDSRQ